MGLTRAFLTRILTRDWYWLGSSQVTPAIRPNIPPNTRTAGFQWLPIRLPVVRKEDLWWMLLMGALSG